MMARRICSMAVTASAGISNRLTVWPVKSLTGGSRASRLRTRDRIEGARWLSERGIVATGSDTMNYGHKPDSKIINLPVFVHNLVNCGIHGP